MQSRTLLLSVLSVAALGAAAALALSRSASQAAAKTSAPESVSLADQTLAPARIELLELAFETASKMPLAPHIKDRSRAQEAVLDAALELDQPRRALAYAQRIADWRSGAGYADLAFYLARHGKADEARRFADLAEGIADELAHRIESGTEDANAFESPQDWQRDRIRAKVAAVHAWLGNEEHANELQAGVVPAEAGKVDAVHAMQSKEDDFDAQLAELDAVIATRVFEEVHNALDVYAQLYDRFFEDAARRARVEARIELAGRTLPAQIRIETLSQLVESALAHGSRESALALVQKAQTLMDESNWTPEFQARLGAELAALRHRAGDTEEARRRADAALALFEKNSAQIVDIERASVLRAIAEAYQTMQAQPEALRTYAKVVEVGLTNPNARPRAEDLSATCCSMARSGVAPEAALLARLHQVYDSLGPPW